MAGNPDLFANLREKLQNAVVQRVVGGIALVVTAGIFVGVNQLKNAKSGNHNASPAPVAAASKPYSAAKPQVNVSQAASAPAADAHADTHTMPDGAPPMKMASTEGANSPMVTAVAPANRAGNAQMAHLDDHLTYQYNALGRRDPFQSLVSGEFVGADVGGDAPPDPGGIKVVGIVWGATDQFALVEDVRGNSLVLRKGDKVQNGYVETLKRDAVVFNLTADGQTQSVVIPLIRKGDQNAR